MSTQLTSEKSQKSPSDTPSDMSSNSTDSCVGSTGRGFTGRGRVIPGDLELCVSLEKEPLPIKSDQVRDKWTHSHEFVFAVAVVLLAWEMFGDFPIYVINMAEDHF